MEAVPFALSVSHFINTVGADAGFAAIVGLALLVVLYFAQARETHTLRDQAADAEDRVAQLELRVAALTRAQAPAPAPAPVLARRAVPASASLAGAVAAGPAAAAAANSVSLQPLMYPGAPAGVGAPALTSATRLIPAHVTYPPRNPAADLTMAAAPVADQAPGSPPPGTVDEWGGGGLGPATAAGAAGAANGVARDPVPRPAGPVAQTLPPPPRVALRPAQGGGPSGARARRASSPGRPSRRRRGILALLGVLSVAVVAAVLFIVTSSAGTSTKTATTQTSSTTAAARHKAPKARRRTNAPAVNPALVTVAVLNGTGTPNLAHAIGSRLAAVGYKEGSILTASDQTQTATVVGYLPGHRSDAQAVATSLKLGSSSVQPVSQSNQSVACPPPAACAAAVIVTVGSDLAAGA
jgi:LytR cell envelope-related transcriptional attenuator